MPHEKLSISQLIPLDPCALMKKIAVTHKVKRMTKKRGRKRIGENQRKILDILDKYDELTARDIAVILWARDIQYKTPEYTSIHRSLAKLYKNGLVEKIGGQLRWRKAGTRIKTHNRSSKH